MAPKIMESLTIKQVNKSPLQQKNELAFLQTHSCIKLRDTLLFFFVLWWQTSEVTPHIHFKEFRDASVNLYMCTGEHATTWVPSVSYMWQARRSFATRRSTMKRTVETEVAPQEYVSQCEGASQSSIKAVVVVVAPHTLKTYASQTWQLPGNSLMANCIRDWALC